MGTSLLCGGHDDLNGFNQRELKLDGAIGDFADPL